jgi:uncharacterized protein (TIGR02246 family)
MKNIIFFLIFISCSFALAQSKEEIATTVVQNQLEAYNAKDINAFMKVFAKDAAIYNFGESKPIAKGKKQVKKVYANLFKNSPQLHSQVINRSVIGNNVLDYELITGRKNQKQPTKLIAIYEIENGLIQKATFIRE